MAGMANAKAAASPFGLLLQNHRDVEIAPVGLRKTTDLAGRFGARYHYDVTDSAISDTVDHMSQHRNTSNRYELLGCGMGDGTKPGSLTTSENHGLDGALQIIVTSVAHPDIGAGLAHPVAGC